eukprot:746756-Hanusia_phi.AAC.8
MRLSLQARSNACDAAEDTRTRIGSLTRRARGGAASSQGSSWQPRPKPRRSDKNRGMGPVSLISLGCR